MAQSTLIDKVKLTEQFYTVSASNNCGQIIIDINESLYTKGFRDYIGGIMFRVYLDLNGEHIAIMDRGYIWNTGEDVSLVIEDIPSECDISIEPLLNEQIRKLKNPNGTFLYPELQGITDLPIAVIFDDSPIMSGGGSGGGCGGASVYVGDDEPENPSEGMLWVDTDDNTTNTQDMLNNLPNAENVGF